ncbi:MAG: threonine synthase [Chloroflexota bacterium]
MTDGALVCSACGAARPLADARWRCDCGGLLDVRWAGRLDPARLRNRPPNLWRYREALPIVDEAAIVTLGEGFTPLLDGRIADYAVQLKLDHLFPSGSYKDRGATVLVSAMRERGVRHAVEDSSGNAGCAIAAYCARAGIACEIYVPAATSPGKLAQIAAYGARLVRVPGDRQATAQAAWDAAQTAYYASHTWNPFFLQGTKTFAYEVAEQRGWRAPDAVVLPVGNGTLLLGAAIGFRELADAGLIDRIPRLVGVQAAACAPLAAAFRTGLAVPVPIVAGETAAEGIAIAAPARGAQILAAVRATSGTFLTVDEDEIAAAWCAMAAQGLYIEPTAAATIAGVEQFVRGMRSNEDVVSVLTGHGLKSAGKPVHAPAESA